MILFFALLFVATAIAGFTALLIFWPLTIVHVRDRHPQVLDGFGQSALISPAALAWVLRGDYRALGDANLNGLATPARVSLMVIIGGLAMAGLLWLVSEVVG